jgi:ketosteroid isomerase-like protein
MVDMFAATDARDIPGFLRYLTDDVAFRFGNAPTLHGHTQVTEALTALFQTVKQLRHTIVGVHGCGDVWVVETVVHYEDRDGRSFSVPACSLLVPRGDRVSDYKIFIDNSGMFHPPPVIARTAV